MKRLLHVIFALAVVSLIFVPPTKTAEAQSSKPNCRTPIPLTPFLKGLDYQEKSLVYVGKDLNCKVKGMTVIFKVSEIVNLSVASPDPLIKEMLKRLSPGDPRRKELKNLLGTNFGAKMWDKPPIGILSRRRAGGRQINWLSVGMGAHATPGKPFPRPIQRVISAYESGEKSIAVWTRVQTAEVDVKSPRYVIVGITLSPYKVVG